MATITNSAIETEPTSPTAIPSSLVLYDPPLNENRCPETNPIGWTTASKSLTSFKIFNKLPTELKFMVWDAIMISREVKVETQYFQVKMKWRAGANMTACCWSKLAGGLKTSTPNPITLQICQASRNLTLLKYQRVFDFVLDVNTHPRNPGMKTLTHVPAREHYIYVDPNIDTLCIDLNPFDTIEYIARNASSHDFKQIRRLALSVDKHCQYRRREGPRSIIHYVQSFPNLREVRLDFKGYTLSELCYLDGTWNDQSILDHSGANGLSQINHVLQSYKKEHPEWSLPKLVLDI